MLKKMILATGVATIACATPAPAFAQDSIVEEAGAELNPENLQMAEKVVAHLLPDGTFAQVTKNMVGNLDGIFKSVMKTVGGLMKDKAFSTQTGAAPDGADAPPDIVEGTAGDAEAVPSLEEMMMSADPYFKERLKITADVVGAEVGEAMKVVEPEFRVALARVFARKYSVGQLAEMDRFFSTPAGTAFARDYYQIGTEGEMISAMIGLIPKLVRPLSEIGAKIEAATAHLPKPPKAEDPVSETQEDEEAGVADAGAETGEEPWYFEQNWSARQRAKVDELAEAYLQAAEGSEAAYSSYEDAQDEAIETARQKYLDDGWTAEMPTDEASPEISEDMNI